MERNPIVTEQLVLRPGVRSDGPAMASILDEVVVAAMGWPPGVVDGYVRLFGRRRPPRRHLVVCDRGGGRPLGVLSHGSAQEAWTIGIMLGPEGRGGRLRAAGAKEGRLLPDGSAVPAVLYVREW